MAENPQQLKKKALEAAVVSIERQFGKGAIMRLGDDAILGPIPSIPTGSIGLDFALGIGGVPRGRVVEIFGPESSGKTTLALHILAEAQKLGGVAAFIDAEHAMDPNYARALGVDIDNLLISQPDTGEQALDTMSKVLRQKNAKEFIKTLGKDFNEVQTNQLIDMLCKYEQFLDEKS